MTSRLQLVPSTDQPIVSSQEGAGVVIVLGGMIVLVRPLKNDPDKDEWLLPKGHLEAGENHIIAAVREAKEETGAIVTIESDAKAIGETEPVAGYTVKWFVGRAACLKTEFQLDKREVGIFPPIVALAKLTYPDHRNILAGVIS